MLPVHPPFVTVVVPARNEARTVGACVRSLVAQDYPPARMEILVVDGMSTDGTVAAAVDAARGAATSVRVLPNPRRSAAAAMNVGIAEARGDVIIRLDAHAEAAPDFVSRAVEALTRTGADAVGGPIETVGDGATGRAIAAAMSSRFGTGGAAFRVGADVERDVDTVAFPAWRREVFDRAGLFDEAFLRNQDDEFHLRLTRGGGRIVLVPGIRATYRCRSSFAAFARQYAGYGFWKTRVLRNHGRLPAARALAPPLFVLAIVACAAASIVTLDARWVLAVAAPYVLANVVASVAAAARRGWDLLPRLPLAFAAMHLAYGAGFVAGLVTPPRRVDERARIRGVFARRDAAPAEERPVLLDARRDAVHELLAALPAAPARILDVGCGRGDSLGTFGDDARAFGVDLLPSRVAAARERRPAARLAAADASLLPFRDGAFDLCLLFTVLSSVKDRELRRDVASEALRVGRAVLVHEFALNPLNRDVRGVRRRELARLFPGCRVTARSTRGPVAGLPTHYVALVRREGATA